ncbi:MAG: response regulator transcription factor [Rhizonema sp. PD38]|nr:response regulator transcription factor [Rhizonema sp. PD38]
MDNKKISILIVDDEEYFRQGLRTLLGFYSTSASYPMNIVGEADCVEQVVKLAIQKIPDIILLDLELVNSDGIIAMERLKEISYSGQVLVLSAHQEDKWIFQAMQKGASGYVFKSRVANQLCDAINTVLRSEIYLPPEAASGFFRCFQENASSVYKASSQLHLTEREQEVLQLLTQGASNNEIAKNLYVTVATVKAHLTNIFDKLKVSSRTQAIVAAIKLGLVQA